MAEIRTLKLNLLADVDQFGRGINRAETATTGFGTTVSKVSKIAAGAFLAVGAAAGYAAIAIGRDATKAALQDEASQDKLAKTLQNVTKATDDQIEATEKWITKQQYASGFSDNQLRDSLGTLVRVTDDVTEAQKLNNLAMDISRGTGKDLETVSLALAKAHEGNLGALTRLGVPLDESIIKTKDFDAATDKLTQLFGGQAATYTDTYQGKLDILNERIGELKEGIGKALIDRFGNLLTVINDVAKGFGGENPNEGLSGSMQKFNRATGIEAKSGGFKLGESLKEVADAFGELFTAISGDKSQDGLTTLESLAKSLETVAINIERVASAYTKGKNALEWLSNESWLGRAVNFVSGQGRLPGRAMGGTVMAGQAYRVGEFGPETLVMGNSSGRIIPANQSGGGNVTINLNGIVDGESARRTIERLLQDSGRRTAAVNLAGAAF